MSRRNQWILLGGLLVILAVVAFLNRSQSGALDSVFSANDNAAIIAVDNPEIRIDKLERIKESKYSGTRRNIFTAALPPPREKHAKEDPGKIIAPPVVTPPPPLVLPVKFFGYAADAQGNHRRACFTNGDEVIIVEEGDTLLGRFRVLRIGNTTLEFEEISSGRRASAVIEEQGPAG